MDKIKFAIDSPTYERAVGLYEGGKVMRFKEAFGGYSAVVIGTRPYQVFVSARHFDQGHCECYLGQNDTLCKHMVAVAIYAVKNGRHLTDDEKEIIESPECSGKLGELGECELKQIKQEISLAMRCLKSYTGPSRIWFAYQRSLDEGCARLSKIVSGLPVSRQTAELLVSLLLRLDKKLYTGGIDDSDGTVGGFMYELIDALVEYAKLDPSCIKSFYKICGRQTCFEWNDRLVKIVDEGLDGIE